MSEKRVPMAGEAVRQSSVVIVMVSVRKREVDRRQAPRRTPAVGVRGRRLVPSGRQCREDAYRSRGSGLDSRNPRP